MTECPNCGSTLVEDTWESDCCENTVYTCPECNFKMIHSGPGSPWWADSSE